MSTRAARVDIEADRTSNRNEHREFLGDDVGQQLGHQAVEGGFGLKGEGGGCGFRTEEESGVVAPQK